MLKFIYQLIAICWFFLPNISFADQPAASGPSSPPPPPVHHQLVGIGGVANNLMEPVTILANFIGTIAIIIGISFLFAAFVKYMQHRVNPLAVPISTVVLLLVMGICLLLIPFLYKLTTSGFALSITPF